MYSKHVAHIIYIFKFITDYVSDTALITKKWQVNKILNYKVL